ncbi:MAG: hypothetical protein QCI38_03400 [Candidatus Thermoplasmatota archaeon]|nr:hypothetical protein [Candidatus Thermoplasmatota archaeon]
MGSDFEEVVVYLTIAAAALSFLIAGFVYNRYRKNKKPHLLLWFLAWTLVGIRTTLEIWVGLFDDNLLLLYAADVMTIGHSILWFLGLAYLLELPHILKKVFPLTYLLTHAILAGFLYFDIESRVAGAAVTYLIFTPAIFFIIGGFFYAPAKKRGKWGMSLVCGAFILWGLDYLVFGIPVYAYGDDLAGVFGWTLGIIFRIMAFTGFVMMVRQADVGGER